MCVHGRIIWACALLLLALPSACAGEAVKESVPLPRSLQVRLTIPDIRESDLDYVLLRISEHSPVLVHTEIFCRPEQQGALGRPAGYRIERGTYTLLELLQRLKKENSKLTWTASDTAVNVLIRLEE